MSEKFMSSFQTKFAKANEGEKKEGEEGGGGESGMRRNRGAKLNPLLSAVTEQYVDDTSLYQPRISRRDRWNFWEKVEELNLPPTKLIVDKNCWMSQDLGIKNSFTAFPFIIRAATRICTSNYWDHFYVNMMFIWLILIIFFVDGWAQSYLPILIVINAGNILILLPPLAALMTQFFPLFGTVVLMHTSYDCVHFYAAENFQHWAIASCLVAQYIEYFYYGGRNRISVAGKCAIGHPPNYIPSWRRRMYKTLNSVSDRVIPKRYAKIFMESTSFSSKTLPSDDSKGKNANDDERDEENQSKSDDDGDAEENQSGKDNHSSSGSRHSGSHIGSGSEHDEESGASQSKGDESGSGDDDNDSRSESESGGDESDENSNSDDDDDDDDSEKKRRENNNLLDETAVKAPGHLLKDILGDTYEPKVIDPDSDDEEVEWVEWTCMVCSMENRRPDKIENPGWSIAFGERGRYLKQTYAIMNANTSKPTCRKCFTPVDYKPPPASAHLFPHNPEPFTAYENYPPMPKFPHGLLLEQEEYRYKYWEPLKSFFFGNHNNPNSGLLYNDWKLRKWIQNEMPEINRYKLKAGETYQVGEIVECKIQKAEYCRARITVIRKNNTYDIRYDMGDELRFVHPSQLRLGFEKGAYAYRVELCMMILWVSFPAGLVFAITTGYNWLTYAYEMVFLVPLLISLCLMMFRITNFIQYVVNFHHAGCWVIFKTTALLTLPLFFLMVTSSLGLAQGRNPDSWGGIIALLVITEVSSLPILYGIRPVYAVMGGAAFFLSSVGFILLSVYMTAKIQDVRDGPPDPFIVTDDINGGVGDRNPYPPKPLTEEYIAVSIVPWLLLVLLVKYIRYHLHAIWDTCLVIRPASKRWKSNPILLLTCMNWKDECMQRVTSLFERDVA
jgi:hypothetical protein